MAFTEGKWLQDVMARSCSPPSTWECFIKIGLVILYNTLQCSEVDASKASDLVRHNLLCLQDSGCGLAVPITYACGHRRSQRTIVLASTHQC